MTAAYLDDAEAAFVRLADDYVVQTHPHAPGAFRARARVHSAGATHSAHGFLQALAAGCPRLDDGAAYTPTPRPMESTTTSFPYLYALLALVGGYLIGSLSFAVIVSRAVGLADPRSYGSGNPGATNVLRSGHRAAAVLTLALDALKGYVPVLAVLLWGPRFGLAEGIAAFTGLAAFLGHLWPVFFRFQGGKGVATAAGVLMAINPLLGLASLATWAIIAAFFRYSSLAAIVTAVFAPFYHALIWGVEPALIAIIGMSLFLVWRHEPNIRKLLAGTESRLGQKAPSAPSAPSAPPAAALHKQPPSRTHSQAHAQPHSRSRHAKAHKKGRQ